jgi:hypothetical protein
MRKQSTACPSIWVWLDKKISVSQRMGLLILWFYHRRTNMDFLLTVFYALITGIGMILGKFLFRFLSMNYWDKVKLASKLQRRIHQNIARLYAMTGAAKISLFKFSNGEHYLSDEPVLKVIKEYNYPAELDTISQSTFLLSQFTELVSKLEIQDLQELNHKSSEMRLLLGKYTSAIALKLAYKEKFFGFIVVYWLRTKKLRTSGYERIIREISEALHTLSSISPFHKLEKLMYQIEDVP